MSALRAYPSLRHTDHLRSWLFTIAQRKATDVIRRRVRRPTSALDGIELAAPSEDGTDPALWAEVRQLPPKQRAAIVHRFVFDLAYAEIGVRMQTTEAAARQNVRAGLRRLRTVTEQPDQ